VDALAVAHGYPPHALLAGVTTVGADGAPSGAGRASR
jgi:hypothetical protein